jgi:hypothetical protein
MGAQHARPLARPPGIASLPELSSRCTELKAPAFRNTMRAVALLRALVWVSIQRTPVTRLVAGS